MISFSLITAASLDGPSGEFQRELLSLESHPGHRGTDPAYDELDDLLTAAIKSLEPLPMKFVPEFRTLPDQDHLPFGVLRKLEAAWQPVHE